MQFILKRHSMLIIQTAEKDSIKNQIEIFYDYNMVFFITQEKHSVRVNMPSHFNHPDNFSVCVCYQGNRE